MIENYPLSTVSCYATVSILVFPALCTYLAIAFILWWGTAASWDSHPQGKEQFSHDLNIFLQQHPVQSRQASKCNKTESNPVRWNKRRQFGKECGRRGYCVQLHLIWLRAQQSVQCAAVGLWFSGCAIIPAGKVVWGSTSWTREMPYHCTLV